MTQYYKEKEINNQVIYEVAKALKEGKLVVFPTDTVYGIGTNAFNKVACKKIYDVKGRPEIKPLTILISNIYMLEELVEQISPLEQKLINVFWPGPLTIKFRKKENVLPEIISAGDEYVRVRLVNDGIIYKLIQTANVPIVAPSANLSGNPTGIKINNIINEFNNKVDYIIDYGDLVNDEVSTIVQVENNKISILREGKLKKEEFKVFEEKNI